MRGINSTSLEADTVQTALYDYILLGMAAPADFLPCP
jgi:hypothetical protein